MDSSCSPVSGTQTGIPLPVGQLGDGRFFTPFAHGADTGSEIQAEGDSENGDASPGVSNNGTCENPVATGASDLGDEDQITQKHGLTIGGFPFAFQEVHISLGSREKHN